MSRSGYSEDYGDDDYSNLAMGRWQAQVNSAIRGKRGQKLLRDLVAALDAMPVKELAANVLETDEGAVCALGAVGKLRGVDVKALDIGSQEFPDESWEEHDWDKLSEVFNIAPQLAREVMYINDEMARTGAERWAYVRRWAAKRIVLTEEELPSEVERGCPSCGAAETESTTPRTTYACGSSDYDQRPGTFVDKCSLKAAT